MQHKKKHIAVLYGGWSDEREVSLVSGKGCADALINAGYMVTLIDVDQNLPTVLNDVKPDICFNALHGVGGEDGIVQGVLECLKIPYTHSGVLASALCMDKEQTKAVLKAHGLPIAKSVLYNGKNNPPMECPFVLKPVCGGSSVGVVIVKDVKNFDAHNLPDTIKNGHTLIMAEEYIDGRELTVAVLDSKALCVTEITSAHEFYDYSAKYGENGSKHILPAALKPEITAKILKYSSQTHKILGCRGVTRVDFRYNESDSDKIVILEINTQPGMTPTSLVPEQAQYKGMSYQDLVVWIVENASCNR